MKEVIERLERIENILLSISKTMDESNTLYKKMLRVMHRWFKDDKKQHDERLNKLRGKQHLT